MDAATKKVVFEYAEGNVYYRVIQSPVGVGLFFEMSTGCDALGGAQWTTTAGLPIGAIRELVRLACGTDIEMRRRQAEGLLHSAHGVLEEATKRADEIVNKAKQTLLNEQVEAADALREIVEKKEKGLDKEAEKGLKEMQKKIDKAQAELKKKFGIKPGDAGIDWDRK